jgi:hypothetical protein
VRTSRRRESIHRLGVAILVMSGAGSLDLLARQMATAAADHATPSVHIQDPHAARPVTPLRVLIDELSRASPVVAGAQAAAEAATHVASQVAALPDPRVTLQQFNVGSPRPFAGFRNGDFAYIGVGVSRDLPFPGKRPLRHDVAAHEAMRLGAHVEVIRQQEIERLGTAYWQRCGWATLPSSASRSRRESSWSSTSIRRSTSGWPRAQWAHLVTSWRRPSRERSSGCARSS